MPETKIVWFSFWLTVLIVMLVACTESESEVASVNDATKPEFVEFGDPLLEHGRTVWLGTCKGCHALGVAGAPPVTDKTAWTPRLEQGMPVLLQHALHGFYGPDYTYMPPRGGNPDLSDKDVEAALSYMLALVKS
jgi:cytochrome c5